MEHTETSDTSSGMSSTSSAIDSVSNNQPVQLLTPMYLAAPASSVRCVASSTPFYINGTKVWSSAPIHIYSETARHIDIEPKYALGQDFVRGWNKLPTELKMRILAFNLVADGAVTCEDPVASQYIDNSTSYGKLLRATPEMADLSRIIYYTKNAFRIRITDFKLLSSVYVPQPSCLVYPKLANNLLIRSLELDSHIHSLGSGVLQRFARGSYGFCNVQSLKILAGHSYHSVKIDTDRFLAEVRDPTRFGCGGSIQVAKSRFEDIDTGVYELCFKLLEPWFIFGCSKAKRGVVAEAEEVGEVEEQDDDLES